jgi:NAD(P)-dependent dehydrogenase (short-subunit alcohol dehydrogenase family)
VLCPYPGASTIERSSTELLAAEQKTMVLTGASRGIGHATVKLFSEAGWRIITCSRQAFDGEACPWDDGPSDHIQVDLGDHRALPRAIADIKDRLAGAPIHALINNAGFSPKNNEGGRLTSLTTPVDTWMNVFHVNFLAPILLARGCSMN